MDCSCYECGRKVPSSVLAHFVALDGRILCNKCKVGEFHATDRLMRILLKSEIERNVFDK